ncbi:MAG: hypothetical protein OC190_16560 [Novosphingobium aromaticivorans]|nr:hypothetical protein [Novosphingobium aromaticivorans]
MSPKITAMMREAFNEFKVISLDFDDNKNKNITDALEGESIVQSSIDLMRRQAAGFTRKGLQILNELASAYISEKPLGCKVVSSAVLSLVLAQIAANKWATVKSIEDQQISEFDSAIYEWFIEQEEERTHYVPCIISAWPIEKFTVGPVQFYPLEQLPVEKFGLSRQEVWPSVGPRSEMAEILIGRGLFHLAETYHASTIAQVTIRGREKKKSELDADLAIDVAIGIIQILMPPQKFSQAARATSRSAPILRATLSYGKDGPKSGFVNRQPGRDILPGDFEELLCIQTDRLNSMSGRLENFLSGIGGMPTLDAAWCNATFWYHEAVAEPLDTVAIAKFETAMEVLFRTENKKGSERRIVEGLQSLLGLSPDIELPGKEFSPRQLAASFVRARSQVLHGTWPTLHTELPQTQAKIGIKEAQGTAAALLMAFSIKLDEYVSAGNKEDTTDAFLYWCRSQLLRTTSNPA